MKTLNRKLHSQRGASILLALLFLLACMMVAASVLMAAASNAGKIRSNYEEQQRYLALSSALRLVAGELEKAEYRGQYTFNLWSEIRTEEDGTETTTRYYSVTQAPGFFSCGELSKRKADGTPDGDAVLSFQKELDGLFAKEFTGVGCTRLPEDRVAALPTNPPSVLGSTPAVTTRELTIKVADAAGIEEQFGTVKVSADMSQSRRIHLKAWLDPGTSGDPTYVMEAELTAVNTPELGYPEEADRLPKDGPTTGDNITVQFENPEIVPTEQTDPAVTWRLDWITREIKKEAADG